MSIATEEVVIYLPRHIFTRLAHDLDPSLDLDDLPEVIVVRVKEETTHE